MKSNTIDFLKEKTQKKHERDHEKAQEKIEKGMEQMDKIHALVQQIKKETPKGAVSKKHKPVKKTVFKWNGSS